MSWIPETLPSSMRERMIDTGRRFSSVNTRDQARDTLQAYEAHKDIIINYGFGPALADPLEVLKDRLESADVVKLSAKAGGTKTATELDTSARATKRSRARGVSVLRTSVELLDTMGTPEAKEAAADVRGRLARTTPAGDDVKTLVTQVEVLRGAFELPLVAQVTADMGGPGTKEALTTAAADLTQKDAAHKKGVPTHKEQEQLDLIDGLIATLCRLARAAARAAANDLGQPAIAKAFELKSLYY